MPDLDTAALALLLLAQTIATILLVRRLAPGRHRQPPVEPVPDPKLASDTTVSVVVATLNEAHRIGPCLAGLARQGPPLCEVLVVDSRSTDGTPALVDKAAERDARIRLLCDAPLPEGWVGKVWALQTGLRHASGDWVLGVDADVEPGPGCVAGAVAAATRLGCDAVSFSPRFAGQTRAERWLQPALLATLIYRCGPAGVEAPSDRVLANGQCFLARRSVLEANGGYAAARASFCDDVTLARHLAAREARVGFLDGSRLVTVRSYASAIEAWREWGRSLDLADATTAARQWADVLFIWLTLGVPVPALLLLATAGGAGAPAPIRWGLLALNGALVAMRIGILVAARSSYERRGWSYWLSPLADPLAALRILLSTVRRPTRWRGRRYAALRLE